MIQKHRHHRTLVSMYSATDKKYIGKTGRVKLDVYDYLKAKARHNEIIPGQQIGKTIHNLPDEGGEHVKLSPGEVYKV